MTTKKNQRLMENDRVASTKGKVADVTESNSNVGKIHGKTDITESKDINVRDPNIKDSLIMSNVIVFYPRTNLIIKKAEVLSSL